MVRGSGVGCGFAAGRSARCLMPWIAEIAIVELQPQRTADWPDGRRVMATIEKAAVFSAPGHIDSPVELKSRYENFIGGHWVAPVKRPSACWKP